VGCRNLGRLPHLGFLIFFDKIFLVNLINHNIYGVEISAFLILKKKNWDFFENFSILEVEIGRNGPGILGANWLFIKIIQLFLEFLLGIKKILENRSDISMEIFISIGFSNSNRLSAGSPRWLFSTNVWSVYDWWPWCHDLDAFEKFTSDL
jgi:hypothetical protein